MQGLFFEDLSVGQSAETTKVVTANDVEAFAAVSGDTNPVHLDEDYAQTTTFQTRIAHGMLSGAYISAVIGTKLPGPGWPTNVPQKSSRHGPPPGVRCLAARH